MEHCYTTSCTDPTGVFVPSLQVVFPNGCGPFFLGEPITILPYEVSATALAPICEGDCVTVQFTADDPDFGIDNVTFDPGANVIPGPPWEFDLCPSVTTNYNVAVNYFQCVDTLELELVVNPNPILSADPYGPFCLNDGNLIDPIVNPLDGSFTWPLGNQSTESLGSGPHEVIYDYTDSNGCTSSIDIPFTIHDTTDVTFLDMFACIDADPFDLVNSVYSSGRSVRCVVQRRIVDPTFAGLRSGPDNSTTCCGIRCSGPIPLLRWNVLERERFGGHCSPLATGRFHGS